MDDWADGHGPAKMGDGSLASDKRVLVDKDSEAAVAGILDKAGREPNGQLSSDASPMAAVFPKGVAAVLQSMSPMGVCDPAREAQRARAKELVDELYERVPWEDFMAELSSRDVVLVKTKVLRDKENIRQAYYTGHMNADSIAEEAGRKIKSFLEAARLLIEGLYVEEGEPEAIKTLIDSAIGETHHAANELKQIRVQMSDARSKI